ncbi:helix-turn-helix domain-containing protein [Streptococcus suis]|uniref:XRE family transcriptional regulator n=2 Tax=Streptococcus suis TaxID=1307 RepID=A0A3R8NZM0_STRSU|nr:helix-turn-helix transcriptional regulator [Streptococcus suis]RRN49328.1 XRE family transcriptional regulator [Streptococcus suis]
MTLDQYVAKQVQKLRKEFQLTQEQLAEAANIDVSSIAKIERGERSNIKINTLEKLISAFNISTTTFFNDYQAIDNSTEPLLDSLQTNLSNLSSNKRKEYLLIFDAILKAGENDK